MKLRRSAALLLAVFFLPCLAQSPVVLSVSERAGVDRANEYVTFGIPVPRQYALLNTNGLCLENGQGQVVPAQFEILARWGAAPGTTSAPAKWILVTYLDSVAANASASRVLRFSGGSPSPSVSIQIDSSQSGKLTVNTGAARFELNTTGAFNLFNQVVVNSRSLLQPLSATESIHYEPAGTLGVVSGSSLDYTPRTTRVTIERAGPLWAVVKVEGSILDGSARAVLDFTARLHFFAGQASARVDFTVENNHPVVTGEWEQPLNVHEQGAAHSVYIGALQLTLRLQQATGDIRVFTEQKTDVTNLAGAVRLYQDSSGTSAWRNYVGNVGWEPQSAAPRLQSYCSQNGYQVTGAGSEIKGRQALGWMTLSRAGAEPRGITAAVPGFWQNFPKALQASNDGRLTVDLFPNGETFRHNFRVGEEKTHTIYFSFHAAGPTATGAEQMVKAWNRPLFAVAAPPWYVDSGALGEVAELDQRRWPLYERYVRVAFEPNPDFNPSVDDPSFGNGTLLEAIQRFNFYGWQDYGDVPLDYEAFGENQAGQMNLKYWYLYGMLVQFCRSGDPQWLDVAKPSAWHLADIDYLHVPDEGIKHWSHGAYFGHSQHDEPGNLNPNRNFNSPAVDLFFGVPDLLLAYYLTGETRFRDTVAEGLAAMLNLSTSFSDYTQPIIQRERANIIFAMIEGYKATGESKWLEHLRHVVGATASLTNKSWVSNPAGWAASHPGDFQSIFMLNQTSWTMGRYLDFCSEYGLPDDLHVAEALEAFSNFLITYAMTEYQPDRASHLHDYFFDKSDPSYQDVNNWALTAADALTYTYKYSGKTRYLDAARKFYQTGVIDPVWADDPPVFMSTKDLVNSLNWGLVFMNRSVSIRVTPRVRRPGPGEPPR
ncbi:MAG: hypothetical protein EHM61_21135 [Acidobacteria bacterium]|nr:MAG: hypothetical protein EHM61_21135 [Acidobacteriota bacterium]